jgi:hypothetical protein
MQAFADRHGHAHSQRWCQRKPLIQCWKVAVGLTFLCLALASPALAQATQDRLPTNNGLSLGWYNAASTQCGASGTDNPNCALLVDDAVGAPDDATTYIKQHVGSNTQSFSSSSAFDIASSAIASVQVIARCQRTVAGAISVQAMIRVNGSNSFASTQAVATSWTDYTFTWTTNPGTAAAWLEADVEGSGSTPLQQFGIAASGWATGEELQCTQVFARVNYTEVAPEAAGSLRSLTGVGR